MHDGSLSRMSRCEPSCTEELYEQLESLPCDVAEGILGYNACDVHVDAVHVARVVAEDSLGDIARQRFELLVELLGARRFASRHSRERTVVHRGALRAA